MKKLISLLLCIALLLPCLCACGGKASQVPDSQLEYDVSNLYYEMQNNSQYETKSDYISASGVRIFKTSYKNLGNVSDWKATHEVNEDMHLDTVTLDLFFDEWIGTLQFKTTRVYQYSQESDIWSLVDVKNFEYIGITEYKADAFKLIEGEHENISCFVSNGRDYFVLKLTVNNVNVDALTANVTYNIEEYKAVRHHHDGTDHDLINTWADTADVNLKIPYAQGIECIIPFGYKDMLVHFKTTGAISYCKLK